MYSPCPARSSSSHSPAVRRHCQTMALQTGRPLARSHRIAVSRWLVMPIPAISSGETPHRATHSVMEAYWLAYISIGSCSTQPGWGYFCAMGCCAMLTTRSSQSNRMLRALVVPSSRASMYCFIRCRVSFFVIYHKDHQPPHMPICPLTLTVYRASAQGGKHPPTARRPAHPRPPRCFGRKS